jgi:hypothetical protein
VVNVIEHRQPEGVVPKMRECKLRSGADWQGVLKQKGIKMGVKQRLGVLLNKRM